MFISDPIKSWAIYGELHEGREAHYYRFEIRNGYRMLEPYEGVRQEVIM